MGSGTQLNTAQAWTQASKKEQEKIPGSKYVKITVSTTINSLEQRRRSNKQSAETSKAKQKQTSLDFFYFKKPTHHLLSW